MAPIFLNDGPYGKLISNQCQPGLDAHKNIATFGRKKVTKSLADSPLRLQSMCTPLYLEKEVLQFLDFYAATLSLWVTLVALALRHRRVNFDILRGCGASI